MKQIMLVLLIIYSQGRNQVMVILEYMSNNGEMMIGNFFKKEINLTNFVLLVVILFIQNLHA
jgi:hypothetical protein